MSVSFTTAPLDRLIQGVLLSCPFNLWVRTNSFKPRLVLLAEAYNVKPDRQRTSGLILYARAYLNRRGLFSLAGAYQISRSLSY